MKKLVGIVLLTIFVMVFKFVVSGAYYDYFLQNSSLNARQLQLLDENKRAIAELEYYKSPNYLFKQKERLQMTELTPNKTVILAKEELPTYE